MYTQFVWDDLGDRCGRGRDAGDRLDAGLALLRSYADAEISCGQGGSCLNVAPALPRPYAALDRSDVLAVKIAAADVDQKHELILAADHRTISNTAYSTEMDRSSGSPVPRRDSATPYHQRLTRARSQGATP